MKQFMKESESEKDETAWPKLRARLRLERAAIDAVKAHADMPRHGKPSTMIDEEKVVVFKSTDKIIRRSDSTSNAAKSHFLTPSSKC
jgi:hypothetical protein